ncbi:integrin alpha-L isoform X2, partial [Silurus asotus]
IGSYFGGSVCVLDLDSDYNTDFLVVGAPHYYQPHPQREGRVYIYRLTQELMLEKVLEVCESARGWFGMTLAAVADINGDLLQDLAVGAPLEDDQRGAVYIYLGKHEQGIRSQYSQVQLQTSAPLQSGTSPNICFHYRQVELQTYALSKAGYIYQHLLPVQSGRTPNICSQYSQVELQPSALIEDVHI